MRESHSYCPYRHARDGTCVTCAALDMAIADEHDKLDAVFPMLDWLLTRIASWTPARWDQHLRDEFGDERANELIAVLSEIRERIALKSRDADSR